MATNRILLWMLTHAAIGAALGEERLAADA